jgi:hypothetical protein
LWIKTVRLGIERRTIQFTPTDDFNVCARDRIKEPGEILAYAATNENEARKAINGGQPLPFVARHENSHLELGNTKLPRVDSGIQLDYQTLLSLTELGSD